MSTKQESVDRIVNAIGDVSLKSIVEQPIIVECSTLCQLAFGLKWQNKKAAAELKRFQIDVFEALEAIDIWTIPINDRALTTTEYVVESASKMGKFDWRFVGWKTRRSKSDVKTRIGYLRLPLKGDAAGCPDGSSIELTPDHVTSMLRKCFPCRNHGVVAYAVHLPGVSTALLHAKANKRWDYAMSVSKNATAMITTMADGRDSNLLERISDRPKLESN